MELSGTEEQLEQNGCDAYRLETTSSLLTITKEQNSSASFDGAQSDRQQGELDHDEPPDGQGEGKPGRDSMDHDAKVGMEN